MVLRFFSFFYSLITRSDLNFALKLLFYLDIVMNPLFHNDLSISDLLKTVRKSVLIYETIIVGLLRVIFSVIPWRHMVFSQEDSVKSSLAGKSSIFSNFGYSKICMQKSIAGMI